MTWRSVRHKGPAFAYGVTLLTSGSPLSSTLSQSAQISRWYVARAQMTATSSAIIVSDQMG
jgi:hypothetical protein